MFVLLHLIFEFIRISILSAVYGFLLSPVFLTKDKTNPKKNNQRTILIGFLFISLFIWRFSYWRDNGLGDFGRVPLNSKSTVTMIDFSYATLVNSKENILFSGIEKLYIENDILYGYKNETYCIYNLKNASFRKNLSDMEFLTAHGIKNRLMVPSEFHNNHWSNYILLFF